MGASPFVGQINMFAGNFAPRGWAFCNGQLLAISSNTALFSLLGTTYGGDGKATFALPNLQGSAPLFQGQGPGLSQYYQGESGGEQYVTLLESEMPAHTHSVNCSTNRGDQGTPAGGVWASGTRGRPPAYIGATDAQNHSTVNAQMSPYALSVAGGSQPHNNMQPFLVVTFIIALQGIFPPR